MDTDQNKPVNELKLCKTAWKLYDLWISAEFADEIRVFWQDFIDHRKSCPECSRLDEIDP